jgi:lipopolysaccharide/colanic/teichoic acid biosynthesis glycosyltransferase
MLSINDTGTALGTIDCQLADPPGQFSGLARYSPYWMRKRLLDLFLGGICSILAVPVIGLAALLVKLTSRGPAFYSQVRLGMGGFPFRMQKLRTMYHNCEHLSGPCWSMPQDPRTTPVGRVLRRLHIDELPQLWNVLRGEMSLVGPRPERPELIPPLERAIPGYRQRLEVRPGITGLAQLQLPPDTNLESVRRKLVFDLYYVHTFSMGLDIAILLCTLFYLLKVPFALASRLLGVPDARAVGLGQGDLTAPVEALSRQAVYPVR